MATPNPGRTAFKLVGIVLFMGAMAWASVPFYSWFCRVTGFGGTTGVAEAAPDAASDITIKVRFDASLDRMMPWKFEPEQRQMEVKLGESALAFYRSSNPTDRPVAGQATYNVYPYEAGAYFQKIECFCFTEQVLAPGEVADMPVNFFVDPAILDDPDAAHIRHITLSYTFYETDLPEGYAALDGEGKTTTN